MKKDRKYTLSHDLLKKYLDAAMVNALDLLNEATALLSQERYARSYFLACASLEETGKAYQAFNAMGRNLNNPAVTSAVKESFESHRSKIYSAMVCMLNKNVKTKETVEKFLKIAQDLEAGREKSMYVDINEKHEVTEPSKLVRPDTVFYALALAKNCLETTCNYIIENEPEKFSAAQDKFMTLKINNLAEMFNTTDFWEFYLKEGDFGKENLDFDSVIKYHDKYYCKKKMFGQANGEAGANI